MFLRASRVFKNRLTRNVFLFYFGSQIILMGLLLFFIYAFMSHSLEVNLRQVVLAKEQELFAVYQKDGESGLHLSQPDFYLRLVSPTNNLLYQAFPKEEGRYNLKQLEITRGGVGVKEWLTIDKEDDEDDLLMVSELLDDHVRLQVGKSTSDLNDQIERLVGVFFSIVLPLLLISFGFALFVADRIIVQINEVVFTLQKIKSGQFNERARVDGSELKELVVLFNHMMDQIEILILKNRNELDHFAHDIRTPMTRFKLIVENALIERNNPKLALQALEDASVAADEIILMISSLFDISLTESGAKRFHKTRFDLNGVLKEVIEYYEFIASEREIALQLNSIGAVSIHADRLQIKRVISNLMDNAVKFSPGKAKILIELEATGGNAKIRISDEGMGIPTAEIPFVFDRFFRGERAIENTPGFGLGLSFVKAMIESHGGSVELANLHPQGTRFSLTLPIA